MKRYFSHAGLLSVLLSCLSSYHWSPCFVLRYCNKVLGVLDHKEGWAPKSWCFWIVVLEKTLGSPLGCKEIKPVNPKGNKSWILDTEAEAPIFWPPDTNSWLTGKDPEAGKDWRQKKKGMTEDKLVGWHHWLNRHEFEQAPGDGEGQGGLVCCSPWDHKQSDKTEWLN